jgi:dTDP-4-amino-4,6-dideoxygalactose transaminase
LPVELPGRRHVYHLYAVRSENRDDLQAHLLSRGVQSGIHYPTPVHLQPAHRDLGYKRGDLPVSERAARTVLSLPMFPELTHQQQDEVISAIGSFVLAGAAQ